MSEKARTFDAVLEVCQHQHRRTVLGALAESQHPLTLEDLTETILEEDHQTTPTEASDDVLAEIRLSLYHSHLPKLAAEGLIHFDQERHLVEPTADLQRVQPALSTIDAANPSLTAPMGL